MARRSLFSRFLAGLLVLAALLTSCGKPAEPANTVGGSTKRGPVESDELQFQPPKPGDIMVSIETDKGRIEAIVYPKATPIAVQNFLFLAQQGYYNETQFHRTVPGFVIQAGDPTGTGTGGTSAYGAPFVMEPSNRLRHYAGALCMAPANGTNTPNQSQFYIVAATQDSVGDEIVEKMQHAGLHPEIIETYRQAGGLPYLDNTATVFGQVYQGMDVVDKIAIMPVDKDGNPKNPVTIKSITVWQYGQDGINSQPPATDSAQPENTE